VWGHNRLVGVAIDFLLVLVHKPDSSLVVLLVNSQAVPLPGVVPHTGDDAGITRWLRDVLGLRLLSHGGYRCRHEDSRRWKGLRNAKALEDRPNKTFSEYTTILG
jgi:hypothetical protein